MLPDGSGPQLVEVRFDSAERRVGVSQIGPLCGRRSDQIRQFGGRQNAFATEPRLIDARVRRIPC